MSKIKSTGLNLAVFYRIFIKKEKIRKNFEYVNRLLLLQMLEFIGFQH